MVTLAPELPGAAAAAELLERSGVVVGLGHTGADARGFGEALRSLRRPLVTHLFNGMEPLHHRQPGPVAASLDALARGATHVELIADGVHLADETVHLVFAMDPGRHVVLVSDAMVAAGMPDGDFELGSVGCGSRTAGRGRAPSRRRSREAHHTPPTWSAVAWCRPASIPSPRWPRPPPHPPPRSAWTTAAA
jgi:N-acetylglucosamine-6-phosphate deacetylase